MRANRRPPRAGFAACRPRSLAARAALSAHPFERRPEPADHHFRTHPGNVVERKRGETLSQDIHADVAIAAPAPTLSRPGGLRRLLLRQVPYAGVAFAIVALIVRFTIRDATGPAQVLYYGAQPPIIAGALLLAGMCWLRARHTRIRAVASLLSAMACLVPWFGSAFGWHAMPPAPAGQAPIRLVTWNIARGALGYDGMVQRLHEIDADVVVLVEAGPAIADRAFWREALPDYSVAIGGQGLLVAAKGDLQFVLPIQLSTVGGHGFPVSVALPQGRFDLLAVDLPSNLLAPRRRPVERVAELVRANTGRPLVVAGDFNTPLDAPALDALREPLRSAFATVGSGYGPTWPSIAPVLHLDQIWFNEHITPIQCTTGWTLRSDHRPVVLEFTVGDGVAWRNAADRAGDRAHSGIAMPVTARSAGAPLPSGS